MSPIPANGWAPRPRMLLDHELRIVRANQSLYRSFGVLPSHLTGTRIDDWINADPTLLYRLRNRVRNGSMPWHVILQLRLSELQVAVVSQILRPLRSRRNGYLLISLAGIQIV
ncbi:MAG: hypothetical protein J5I81_09650 [Nitrococcus mobilis]|nr:hypothetical protein [Nitrococcus mobilis]